MKGVNAVVIVMAVVDGFVIVDAAPVTAALFDDKTIKVTLVIFVHINLLVLRYRQCRNKMQ